MFKPSRGLLRRKTELRVRPGRLPPPRAAAPRVQGLGHREHHSLTTAPARGTVRPATGSDSWPSGTLQPVPRAKVPCWEVLGHRLLPRPQHRDHGALRCSLTPTKCTHARLTRAVTGQDVTSARSCWAVGVAACGTERGPGRGSRPHGHCGFVPAPPARTQRPPTGRPVGLWAPPESARAPHDPSRLRAATPDSTLLIPSEAWAGSAQVPGTRSCHP